MTMPEIEDLPYENPTFFRKLFKKITVHQVVEVFTYLLFEENVLLVAEEVEDLLPVMFAIKSFLHPFRVGVHVPHLHDDLQEHDEWSNLLANVCSPIIYLMGIWSENLEFCTERLADDPPRKPPLLV